MLKTLITVLFARFEIPALPSPPTLLAMQMSYKQVLPHYL